MYHKTIEDVIATLQPENGEVFILSNGRRMLFAKCNLKINIVQYSITFKSRNPNGYNVKNRYILVG